jgi:lipid-A-disaccharide synthase-like uncharacterized protein
MPKSTISPFSDYEFGLIKVVREITVTPTTNIFATLVENLHFVSEFRDIRHFSSQHQKFAMPFLDILINVHFVRIKKKMCWRLKGYFGVLLTLKEPRGGLTALLLFYLLVSAYQILIVGSASALFPQLYTIPCPPKKR